MMIQLNFLGSAQVLVDGRLITARLDKKELALLAYLAAQRGEVSRDKAAELLWGDVDDLRAKQSLRQALSNIRQLLPGAIDSRGHHVLSLGQAVQPHTDLWLFDDLRERADLAGACALYRGPLLDGLGLRGAEAFEDWLAERRRYCERLVLDCLTALINDAQRRGDSVALENHARQMLIINPLKERAYRALVLALGRTGRFTEALGVYAECAEALRRELNVAPSADTVAIYERVLLARVVPRPELPYHAVPFVGRERELAEAGAMLLRPDCRLLTLLGPGGVGKTRLSIELGRRMGQSFLHGYAYVPFESYAAEASEAGLLIALAKALDLKLIGSDFRSQIIDFLRPREMLLMLDNFELFAPMADVLTAILRQTRDVKLLVTSRQRLDVPDEMIFHLAGLSYPAEDQWPPASNLSGYDAPMFFTQVTARINPEFAPLTAAKDVARICRLVEGLPLALEMIALWTLEQSCAAIADRLAADMPDLLTSARRFPDRHRSLHVVFGHSWSRLMPREQECLRCLAVVAGSISIEAAEAIAGATKLVLQRLVAQSMLETPDKGRYALHPLVRAFVLEKLVEAGEFDEISVRHFDYFSRFVVSRLPELHGAGQLVALRQLEEQFANIRAAWRYGVEHAPAGILEMLLDGITRLCQARTWHGIGIEVLQEGIEPLARRGEEHLRVHLLLHQGLMHYHLGNYDAAQACAQAGSRANDGRLEAQVLFLMALIYYDQNRYDEAEPLFLRSLALNQQNEALTPVGDALVRLGNLSLLRTFFSPTGKIPYKPPRAFVHEHRLPTPYQKAGAEAALRYYEEALTYFIRAGSLAGIAHCRGAVGFAHYNLHDYEVAADAFEEAARQFRQLDAAAEEADSLMWLAWTQHHQGKVEEARLSFHEALRTGLRASANKGLLDCLQKYSLHRWSADKQHFIPLAINAFVAQHPNTGERMRVVAQEWMENISHIMREDEGQAAVEKALAFGRSQALSSLVHYLVPAV